MEDASQFSIGIETKNCLDRYKAKHKEEIIQHFAKKKRFVTNTDVIQYLLDHTEDK